MFTDPYALSRMLTAEPSDAAKYREMYYHETHVRRPKAPRVSLTARAVELLRAESTASAGRFVRPA